MSGLPEKQVTLALADYGEQLYQLTYNYDYESIRDRVSRVHMEKKLNDLSMLGKVAKMSDG
jgi:hypothetical protein